MITILLMLVAYIKGYVGSATSTPSDLDRPRPGDGHFLHRRQAGQLAECRHRDSAWRRCESAITTAHAGPTLQGNEAGAARHVPNLTFVGVRTTVHAAK